jgi:signal peptidase II
VAALVVALDQWAKHLVVTNLALYESWAPIPALENIFTIHHITNTGAAFGLFQDGNLFFMIVAVIVSLVILFYYRYVPDGQWFVRLSLGLQLGGALGNLVDRLRTGSVVDFMNFQIWPVFNVADMSIIGGVILLALLLLREDYLDRKKADVSGAGEAERELSSG